MGTELERMLNPSMYASEEMETPADVNHLFPAQVSDVKIWISFRLLQEELTYYYSGREVSVR